MDRWSMPLTDPRWEEEMCILGDERIGAMVCKGCSAAFVNERVSSFRLNSEPSFRGIDGELYTATR